MLNTVFLIPIDHRGIDGKLFQQYLELQSWCERNNSQIFTCSGLFLNFARNFLATGGRGNYDTRPIDAEWLFWIDSDIQFTIEQIDYLHRVDPKHKFVTGWYKSDQSDTAMIGRWDEDYFREHLHMPFYSGDYMEKKAKESPTKLIKADWCGFGFTKVHRSIYEKMEYPYYPLNPVEIKGCRNINGEGKIDVKDMSFEDVSFCNNCYATTGIKPLVVPKLRVGHLKSFFV